MLPEQNEIKLIELFKTCIKCGNIKVFSEFYKKERHLFGVSGVCKSCDNKRASLRDRAEYSKLYRGTNKVKLKKRSKSYYKANRERLKTKQRAYRRENLDECKARSNKYQKENKTKIRSYKREYLNKNPKYKLYKSISGRVWFSLKGNKKGRHWEDLVGYTLNELKKHLEKLFTKGMTWNNYGRYGWHLEHKIPIDAFNFTKTEHSDFKRCWALKNLQPMWAEENLKKGAKLGKHFQPSLLF